MKRPRIVVVGTGAIGGSLAARLTRAGHDVTPVTGNKAVAEALATEGYRVRELDGTEWSIRPCRDPRVSLDGSFVGPFDVALLTTKATTLPEAVRSVLPHLAPGAPVVTCQNGLPESIAAEVAGQDRVLGCVVVYGATMVEPGVYQMTSKGRLQLGRPFESSPSPADLAAVLEEAMPTEIVEDLTAIRWSKLALNCATSTLGAVSGLRLGSLLRRRHVRRLVLELWTEIDHVARESGITMAPIGGTLDVSWMALGPAERAAPLGSPRLALKHSVLLAVGMKYRRMRSSMLVALERGRMPEIDYLNGEIVRRGRTLGVPTPVNQRLVTLVHEIAAGKKRPSPSHLRPAPDQLVQRVRS